MIGGITFWPAAAQLTWVVRAQESCFARTPPAREVANLLNRQLTNLPQPPPDAAYPATREPHLQIRAASDACAVSLT